MLARTQGHRMMGAILVWVAITGLALGQGGTSPQTQTTSVTTTVEASDDTTAGTSASSTSPDSGTTTTATPTADTTEPSTGGGDTDDATTAASGTTTTASGTTTTASGTTTTASGTTTTASGTTTTASGTTTTASGTTTTASGIATTASGITTTTTTSPPTATASTPTTEKPTVKHNSGTAVFDLTLRVSGANDSHIVIVNTTAVTMDLLRDQALRIFLPVASGVEITRLADDQYVIHVYFMLSRLAPDVEANVTKAVESMVTKELQLGPSILSYVAEFFNSTSDVCNAKGICPPGYSCDPEGCASPCATQDCNGHGICEDVLRADGLTTDAVCRCDSSYETEYHGAACEDSRIGSDKVVAIVAGVLGTVCLILIIVCVVLVLRLRRRRTRKDYNFTQDGFRNSAYDEIPIK